VGTDKQDSVTWRIISEGASATWQDGTSDDQVVVSTTGETIMTVKSIVTGLIKIQAISAGLNPGNIEISVKPGNAVRYTATVVKNNIYADKLSTTSVKIDAYDNNNNRADNYTGIVTVTNIGPVDPAYDTKLFTAGSAEFKLLTQKTAGQVKIRISELNLGTTELYLTTLPKQVTKIDAVAYKTTLVADGSDNTIIQATLKDVDGNVTNTSTDSITFDITGMSTETVTVNAVNGIATTLFRSGTQSGTIGILCSIMVGTTTKQSNPIVITMTAKPEPGTIILTTNKTELTADGNSTMLIYASLADVNGNKLMTGTNLVEFTVSGEGYIMSGTETLKTVFINAAAGVAVMTIKSTTKSGDIVITARTENVTATTLIFKTKPGTAIKLITQPESARITADGTDITSVYAIVKDMYNNTVSAFNGTVTFNLTGPGTMITPATLQPVNGTAEIKVQSKIEIGTITVTAIAAGLTGGTTTLLTTNSDETNVMLEINPIQIHSGDKSIITIKITDKSGNTVPAGRNVTLSGQGIFSATNAETSLLTGTTNIIYTGTIAGEIPIKCSVPGLNDGTAKINVLASTQTTGIDINISTPVYAPGLLSVTLTAVDNSNNKVPAYQDEILFTVTNKNTNELIISSQIIITNGQLINLPYMFKQPGVYVFETTGLGLTKKTVTVPIIINRFKDSQIVTATNSGSAKLTISSNTFDTDIIVELTSDDVSVTVIARDKNGANTGFNLTTGKHLTLSLPYKDTDNDGLIDGTDVPETNLRPWQITNDNPMLLSISSDYKPMTTGYGLDTQLKTLSFMITQPGTYKLMGISTDPALYNVIVYPTPFTDTATISFETGAQCEITINIYSLSGRLVRTIKSSVVTPVISGQKQTVNILFDGTDNSAKQLSNGTYIYKLTTQNENITHTKTGKLTRIK
jgi:hypothetical protein